MGKSALRTYALNLAQIYKTQGIHIAHVIIDGMVNGDRVNKALFGLGRLARLTRGTGGLNIDAIAENYWMLYQQTHNSGHMSWICALIKKNFERLKC